MAFSTAITGLKASTTALDVAGNNIANASTVGFKTGRTEFADIFSTVVVGSGSAYSAGSGVIVADIAQDFTSGTIQFTNNNLDLAIDGSGFFQLNDGQGGISYTRSGGFELDKNGNVVSKNGNFLQGFGLDADGNIQPVGNLSVSEKESKPQATQIMGLSVNIDARKDADQLLRPYNPSQSSSYSYSTTNRVFDSLGNENTIKFDYVEQPSVRERQTLSLVPTTGFNDLDSEIITLAGADIPLSAVPITTAAALATDIAVTNKVANLGLLKASDPRIDDISVNATTGKLEITYLASAANVEDVVLTLPAAAVAAPAPITATSVSSVDVSASAVQRLQFNGTRDGTGELSLGTGANTYKLTYKADDTAQVIAKAFETDQAAILAVFPDIESVLVDPDDPTILNVTYKPNVGAVDPLVVAETFGTNTVLALDVVAHPGINGATGAAGAAVVVEEGDNSFEGVYQMYAYLNGTDLLDIGKALPPGDAGSLPHEAGPILVTFTATGLLDRVNGKLGTTLAAQELTIFGADAANPINGTIRLDVTGTTQFASESIVKASTQDGFTKGDLIGVNFASDGTMVASYSNGENTNLGIVALATFENQSGLQPIGDTAWTATLDSGQAILNPPGTGLNGQLRSAALEQSNVDLSEQLVKLIEAQRNFQANSKTLQTENSITQTILQIS